MTQELIWGKSGSPHIDGNDIGTINLAMRGVGNYVLDYKDKLKATVASANKITIGTGVMSFEGRDIIISAAETVTIESGSQGMKRNDIICEHYHRDTSTGVETTNLVAIKGTPASSNPKDPTIPSGTILGGATDAYMPLWRVPLDGITVGTPVQLFEILTPLKTVGDSVTHIQSIRTGSIVASAEGGSSVILFSTDEFSDRFGRLFDESNDFFAVMNADGKSSSVHVECATWDSSKGMYAVFNEKTSGLVRVNYVCIMANQ